MVLTLLWMINVEADFDEKTKELKFKKMKWRVPLETIHTATLSMTEDRVTIKVQTNKKAQNDILVKCGGKRINKDTRKLQFPDTVTARDFLFHIKRLNHFWTAQKITVIDECNK